MEENLPEMSGLYHPYVPVYVSANIQSTNFKLLTLAVSAMLYIIAEDVAPFIVSIISQFFLLCS